MGAKTVGKTSHDDEVVLNPLAARQKEDVAKMRSSLLSCSEDTGISISAAMKNLTILRVYHQLTRIVKYTEMMDRIEAKLYAAIDYELDTCSMDQPETLVRLLALQERLQKSMIESQKLIEPYLNMELFNIVDLAPSAVTDSTDNPITKQLMTSESRDKVRATAQNVLNMLNEGA